MLTPSWVTPDDFHRRPAIGREQTRYHGELRLYLAILADAIDTYETAIAAPARVSFGVRRDAERWLFSDDRLWPVSFLNVCDALGIDPGYLRRRLSRLRRRRTAVTH